MDKAVHLAELVEQRAGEPALGSVAGLALQAGDIGVGDLGVDGLLRA